jgi:hypothetical protein
VGKIFFASDTEEKDFNTEGTESTEKKQKGSEIWRAFNPVGLPSTFGETYLP